MFTVIDTNTLVSQTTAGAPYANELADLQRPFLGMPDEYVNVTTDSLIIATDSPAFIRTGTGNDAIFDNSNVGNTAIDPGSGTNFVQVSSNPFNHDTVVVDPQSDAPLTDIIAGLKVGDDVVIRSLTALSPDEIANNIVGTLPGLMLTIPVPATGSAAQIFLSGYFANDLAPGGRLSAGPVVPTNGTSPYLVVHVNS